MNFTKDEETNVWAVLMAQAVHDADAGDCTAISMFALEVWWWSILSGLLLEWLKENSDPFCASKIDGTVQCFFCGETQADYQSDPKHKDRCPYVRLKEAKAKGEAKALHT